MVAKSGLPAVKSWLVHEIAARILAGRTDEEIVSAHPDVVSIDQVRNIRNDPDALAEVRAWHASRYELAAAGKRLRSSTKLPDTRHPLPNNERVELWQAVAWLATGKPRKRNALQRFCLRLAIRRGEYLGSLGLESSPTWLRIELASNEILEAARAEKLNLYGFRFVIGKDGYEQSSTEPVPVPKAYLAADITIASFRSALEGNRADAEDEGFTRVRKLPQYRDVTIFRDDLEKCWPLDGSIQISIMKTPSDVPGWVKRRAEISRAQEQALAERDYRDPAWPLWRVISWIVYRTPAELNRIKSRHNLLFLKQTVSQACTGKVKLEGEIAQAAAFFNNDFVRLAQPEVELKQALAGGRLSAVKNNKVLEKLFWYGDVDVTKIEGVYFTRDDVINFWPGTKTLEAKGTSAARSKTTKKLVEEMRLGPPSKAKALYREDCIAEFGVSARSFIAAWESAKIEVGPELAAPWEKPGRRS